MAKYQRPVGSYAGAGGLSNRTKYQDDAVAVPKRAISSAKVDGDVNYLVDAVNELDEALLSASLTGAVPNLTGHSGKFLTNNGTTLSWGQFAGSGLADGSVGLGKMVSGTANRLIGNNASGAVAEVAIGSGLSLSSGTLAVTLTGVPSGVVSPFAGATAPSGWLLCYGQAVSRTTYAALFTAIGTAHGGGDGSTTFNLPDLRGRAVFGVDNMGGSTASRVTSAVSGITGTTLGAVGGNQNMHQHTHGVTDGGHSHTVPKGGGFGSGGTSAVYNTGDSSGGSVSTSAATTGISIQNAGSGSSQNMPPAMMLNFIIKT